MTHLIKEQRIETVLPKALFLYGQWYGDRNPFSFGGSNYNYVLTREVQPRFLNSFFTGLSDKDFIQSSNIVATTKTEVITDTDFIFIGKLLQPLMIEGKIKAKIPLSLRADSIYNTYLDSVRITILKKNSSGTETQIAQEEYPKDSSQPFISSYYDYYIPRFHVNLIKDISETEILTNETVLLRLEVFGHSENASASNNKIGILFGRGTSDISLYLPVHQDG